MFKVNNKDTKITPNVSKFYFNPLSTNPTKWSNTLKRFAGMQVNTGWVDSLCHTATEYLLF